MKNSETPFLRFSLLCFLFLFSFIKSMGQCNVNEKYDKIISAYHSSIALKDNGVYAVWGSAMQKTGATDQLSPQDINSTNYTGLTGTVLKAAMGGKNAGAQVDQAVLLTTTGLWAWGIAGNVVSTGVKSGAAFGRTSTTSANGFNTYGLPSTLTPTDVASLYATYQTLILLTTSGNVWVLTQTNQTVEANGGTTTTAGSGSSQWKQVKTGASTYLTNVTAVRGQVSSNALNAFIALTSTGEVYTWGNSTYLGNSTASAARNYATQMTIPSEFTSSVPKMIGVTGGIGTTSTTKNTYYLLSNAGNLYSLGDNTQRQCGDFTITERTAWVRVKKSSAASDYLTNINFFSCQEHNTSYPATAAVLTDGSLYTWGNNSSGMIGRTDNGLAGGGLTTASFDPGSMVGFSGKAVSVEIGGHTMVYLKEGSSQFCYVGHYTNGSMGDGTSGNNGAASASTLKHDCNSTPSISICGYVPIAASSAQSVISASPTSIVADGASTSLVTVRLKDASGNNLTSSGGTVTVTTSAGTAGSVTDNNDGTYTLTLTSSTTATTANLGFAINGATASNTVQVNFTSTLPLYWMSVQAYRQNKWVQISWTTTNELNTKNFSVERSLNGTDWTAVASNIPAIKLAGNNQYRQTDTAYNAGKISYRIKQQDVNGRSTYSPVRMVSAITEKPLVSVYPIPADNSFYLGNAVPAQIKKVNLVSFTGTTVKSWNGYQSAYPIQELPAGNYILRIETVSDVQVVKFSKQ